MNVIQDWKRYNKNNEVFRVEVIDEGKRPNGVQYWKLRVIWKGKVMHEEEDCAIMVMQYFTDWVCFLNDVIEVGAEHEKMRGVVNEN